MYKISKIVCISCIIIFISSWFLATLNDNFVVFTVLSLIIGVFSFYSTVFFRFSHKRNLYTNVTNQFYKLLDENRFLECEALLNINERLVSKFYYYKHTLFDIGRQFDGYKGYSVNYRMRNNNYFKLYIKSNQYQKGIDLYKSLPNSIQQEHLDDVLQLEKLNYK